MRETNSLKNGIFIVLMVNILNLIIRLLLNFLLPKYLIVDVYSDYKFFQLLVGYIGILHFGFVDGVYIKFGGKDLIAISKAEICQSFASLLAMEVIITGIVVVIGMIIQQPIVLIAATAIIATEVMWLFQYIYQATGEFKKYGRITSLNTIFLFSIISVLLLFGTQNSYLYMGAYSLVMFIVAVLLYINSGIHLKRACFDPKEIFYTCEENIKIGIFVMIGNFASQLLTSLDRWFIKILMTSVDFAQYSFAASLETFLSFLVTPFSITLYNFFCRDLSNESVTKIEEQIYVFAIAIISCAFPAKWIIEHFITNYLLASDVIFYLFASKAFGIVVACIFVNLYKATKKQRLYSLKMIIVIVVSIVLNACLYFILRTKEALSIATLLTMALWFFLCKLDFNQYKLSIRAEAYFLIEIMIFIILGNTFDSVNGFIGYLAFSIVLSAVMMRSATKSFINTVFGIVKDKIV